MWLLNIWHNIKQFLYTTSDDIPFSSIFVNFEYPEKERQEQRTKQGLETRKGNFYGNKALSCSCWVVLIYNLSLYKHLSKLVSFDWSILSFMTEPLGCYAQKWNLDPLENMFSLAFCTHCAFLLTTLHWYLFKFVR